MAQRMKTSSSDANGGSSPRVRIGELSRRVGVRPETLRAWERRYSLLEPDRTDSGYRLYSLADETRVREMTSLISQGLAASEAAKLAREAPNVAERTGSGVIEAGRATTSSGAVAPAVPHASEQADAGAEAPASAATPVLAGSTRELLVALKAFDDTHANRVLDAAFARFSLDLVLGEVVLPVLVEVGEGWVREEITVAQEHFATEFMRGRLLAVARGWGSGDGPLALLACPPAERHDLGLVCFGLALRDRGWRIAFLGGDTPPPTLTEAAAKLAPDVVVVAALDTERFEHAQASLADVVASHRVFLGGAGASDEIAGELGAEYLPGAPVAAAAQIVATVGAAHVA